MGRKLWRGNGVAKKKWTGPEVLFLADSGRSALREGLVNSVLSKPFRGSRAEKRVTRQGFRPDVSAVSNTIGRGG